jgi:predicted nucleic acid-binding protein
LLTSLLTRVEVASALYRKESFGDISRADTGRAIARFDGDCSAGRIILTPLHLEIAHAAADLIRRLKLPHSRVGLRSLDALHLATAIAAGTTAVVTTDARLREASLLAGLGVKPS